MAKGAMKPKKEVKKPKKDAKDAKPAAGAFEKGVSGTGDGGKRKG